MLWGSEGTRRDREKYIFRSENSWDLSFFFLFKLWQSEKKHIETTLHIIYIYNANNVINNIACMYECMEVSWLLFCCVLVLP